MTLEISEERLRALLPNIQITVKGETPLSQKLLPFLEAEELWLTQHVLPDGLLTESEVYAERVIVYRAYAAAIPQLDLVLTPNGLATVGNGTLSPASKARTESLVNSLCLRADTALDSLLHVLPLNAAWLASGFARHFSSTLFPTLSDLLRPLGEDLSLDRWLSVRRMARRTEDIMAAEWFSPELMDALRDESLRRPEDKDRERDDTLHAIRRVVLAVLAKAITEDSQDFARLAMLPDIRRTCADITDRIRKHPDSFPEWHQSATALRFDPPVFRNRKHSSGYFF